MLDKIIVRLMRLLTRQGLLIEEHGVRYLAGIDAASTLAPGTALGLDDCALGIRPDFSPPEPF